MAIENVFVYGSLKRGFLNHHVMTGTEFLAAGTTQPVFAMIDLGRYPAVTRGSAAVAGEVYAVPGRLMERLDRLEDNGRVYRRAIASITIASGALDAWIYLYLLAHGNERQVAPYRGILSWQENAAPRP